MAEQAPEHSTGPAAASRKRPRVSSIPAGRPAPPPPPPAPTSSTSLPSAPSAPLIPNESLGTLPIHPPAHYLSLASTNPSSTAFQQPFHLTSFSYSETRELLLEKDRKDEALAVYREPRMGSDLNRGFPQAVWREGSVDEGLDALLDTLSEFARSDPNPPAAADLLSKISLVTWRGMLTKLMVAVYECESVSQGRRGDGWEMNAMVVDGCLYLEESNPPSKLAAKSANESSYLLQSYYGYSFESFCTQPHPSPTTASHTHPGADVFDPPNTNVQWCSVVKTNLGGFRTIVGGEVDCVRPGADAGRISTRDFIELKTNMMIQSQRDEVDFERQKLLKHYVQSFLLGVPTVTVGFRTRQGQLSGLQHFNTLEIPRLVRGKPHAWDPLTCLASARELLSFIYRTVSTHASTVAAESALSSTPALAPAPSSPCPSSPSSPSSPSLASDGEDPLPSFPVFRLSFTPSSSALGPAGLTIRELTPGEVTEQVLGAKRDEKRVGFLLERWVREVRERRRKIASGATPSAPPPAPSTAAPGPSGRRVPPPPPPPPAATAANGGGPVGGGSSSVLAGLKR
ncbi:hypothetical protein JCM6882_007046 [Rhodosporidiobolus microsporus]